MPYGNSRDEDDGVLLELEDQATQQLICHYNIDINIAPATSSTSNHADDCTSTENVDDNDSFLIGVDGIQTQKEISTILLDIKKKALLKKYSLL
jgi:hypothetical protein